MRSDRERLLDALEAIANIERYATLGRAEFDGNELVQSWMVRHLQILGEAVGRLGEDFRKTHAHLQWNEIIGMRNILVHEYFGIDLDIVWAVVENELNRIKIALESALDSTQE